jgi:hypothetical protein
MNNWGSTVLLTDSARTVGLHTYSIKPKAECEEQRQTEGLGARVTKTGEWAHARETE